MIRSTCANKKLILAAFELPRHRRSPGASPAEFSHPIPALNSVTNSAFVAETFPYTQSLVIPSRAASNLNKDNRTRNKKVKSPDLSR